MASIYLSRSKLAIPPPVLQQDQDQDQQQDQQQQAHETFCKAVDAVADSLLQSVEQQFASFLPASDHDDGDDRALITKLFSYTVPKLGDNGACSRLDELDPVPYDLRPILLQKHSENAVQQLLAKLQALVADAQARTQVGWVSINATPRVCFNASASI